ncbi:nuclear transport factor 2 family protein [Catenulispora pinisilvae]|uniref:nuclear transport factor 2 family protein n=1 Tax=Catenulispora pinisilvae TaxID=2705253 RepID=UPI001891B686|nr:nuclear transport factor 2 family protein [Catenulispora pinisilvae]
MSEQSNIAIVRELYAALSKGDTAHVAETLLGDRVRLNVSGSHHAHAREHKGKQNVASYFSSIQSLADGITIEPETVAASGDQVLAVIRVQRHSAGAPGRSLDIREAQAFTVTDGKITQITNYAGDQKAKDDFFA